MGSDGCAAVETLVEGDGRAGIGMASVAVQAGDRLFLGTFAGDRIAHTPMPEAP
jgi:hypothetical protein